MDFDEARQLAAQCWSMPGMKGKAMDPYLVDAIALRLVHTHLKATKDARVGCVLVGVACTLIRSLCPACDNGHIQDGPDSSHECELCGKPIAALRKLGGGA